MAGALDGDQKVDLYYSTHTKEEAVYSSELQNLAKGKANLILHPFVTADQGHLTADYIFKASQNIDNTAFLVCGPPGMMAALRKQLRQRVWLGIIFTPRSLSSNEIFGWRGNDNICVFYG